MRIIRLHNQRKQSTGKAVLKTLTENAESAIETIHDQWSELPVPHRLHPFERLPHDRADDFFLKLSSRDQLQLLLALPKGERRIWLRLLAPDNATHLIQLAPEGVRPDLNTQLDEISRREVSALLSHNEDAAGKDVN